MERPRPRGVLRARGTSRAARAVAPGVLLAAALSACSTREEGPYFGTTRRPHDDPRVLYLNNSTEPEYLDPQLSSESAGSTLIENLFEGLTALHPEDARPTPAVALRWDVSDDNRHFRFHLRPDARWSDGRPVTAHDFVYGWTRLLRPSTASRAAANLYGLRNAVPFHLGRLRVATRELELRAAPGPGAPPTARWPAGVAVTVLAHSPARIATAVPPLTAHPDLAAVTREGGSRAGKVPEGLGLGPGRERLDATPDGGWRGREVQVTRHGPRVACDGEETLWLEVTDGRGSGWLPGCVLERKDAPGSMALVRRHGILPTFDPRTSERATAEREPSAAEGAASGWVEANLLAEDGAVLGVRAADELTLEVEMERPTPYLLDLAAHPSLYPARRDVIELFERRGEVDFWVRPGNIVSNGPFVLESWRFRYEITMRRNPHYHARDSLRLDRVVWLMVEDYQSTLNLYRTAEIDYIGQNASLPSEAQASLVGKRDFYRPTYLGTYWFELNVERPPLDDVRVRRALNQALDKKELVERVTRGGQVPATHFVPDETGSGYSRMARADREAGVDPFGGPDTVFDPARARRQLEEAGYRIVAHGGGLRAEGFPPVELLYNHGEGHRSLAIAMQAMWKRHLGVSVSLRSEEWRVMQQSVKEKNFHIVRFGWIADYNHPQTWLDTFLSHSPQNMTGWKSVAFDETMRRAETTADPVESIRLFREAERIAVSEMPRIPLYFYTKVALVKPYLRGFWGNARNTHLVKWMWIDPAWQERGEGGNEPAYPPPEFPPPGRYRGPSAQEAPP